MKKAFTLIEVIVAILIVFMSVYAILNIVSNNKKLIQIFLNNQNFALKASIALIENNKNLRNNYERLIDFNITNDKIIEVLKKDNINLEKKIDYNEEYNISKNAIEIILTKLKAYNRTNSIIIYSIGMQ